MVFNRTTGRKIYMKRDTKIQIEAKQHHILLYYKQLKTTYFIDINYLF